MMIFKQKLVHNKTFPRSPSTEIDGSPKWAPQRGAHLTNNATNVRPLTFYSFFFLLTNAKRLKNFKSRKGLMVLVN